MADLCHRVCWRRCWRRVLQEEEGDVPLVTQLHKVAALQRRLVQQLAVAGHDSHQVATGGGHRRTSDTIWEESLWTLTAELDFSFHFTRLSLQSQ